MVRDSVNSIDLHGYDSETAEFYLELFIDKSFVQGVEKIYINHGKGAGILKETVHAYLKQNNYVKKYYVGGLADGGYGITIAELAKVE